MAGLAARTAAAAGRPGDLRQPDPGPGRSGWPTAVGGRAVPLAELAGALAEADVLVTCTGGPDADPRRRPTWPAPRCSGVVDLAAARRRRTRRGRRSASRWSTSTGWSATRPRTTTSAEVEAAARAGPRRGQRLPRPAPGRPGGADRRRAAHDGLRGGGRRAATGWTRRLPDAGRPGARRGPPHASAGSWTSCCTRRPYGCRSWPPTRSRSTTPPRCASCSRSIRRPWPP